jgi:prevent-host-death family protein
MTAIGVRALKNQLSRYLKRVQGGERLVVTARGKAVAILSPPSATETDRRIEAMLREGAARWGGRQAGRLQAAAQGQGPERGASGDRGPALRLYIDSTALVGTVLMGKGQGGTLLNAIAWQP